MRLLLELRLQKPTKNWRNLKIRNSISKIKQSQSLIQDYLNQNSDGWRLDGARNWGFYRREKKKSRDQTNLGEEREKYRGESNRGRPQRERKIGLHHSLLSLLQNQANQLWLLVHCSMANFFINFCVDFLSLLETIIFQILRSMNWSRC